MRNEPLHFVFGSESFKRAQLKNSATVQAQMFLNISQYLSVSFRKLNLIIRIVQAERFHSELNTLKAFKVYGSPSDRKDITDRHKSLKGKLDLCQLDPFIDSNVIICVGDRIQNAMVPDAVKHPIVLPKKGHVTELVIRHFHKKALHQGRGITVSEIRNTGYWIINCSSNVANTIAQCLICRRLRSPIQEQKMASLPVDRLEPTPRFTSVRFTLRRVVKSWKDGVYYSLVCPAGQCMFKQLIPWNGFFYQLSPTLYIYPWSIASVTV